MGSDLPGSWHEPDHVVLVRLVTRGLSEGTITLEDIKGLTGREIRALLVERSAPPAGTTAARPSDPAPVGISREPGSVTTTDATPRHRGTHSPKARPHA